MNNFLQTMTDTQLARLYDRIVRRIYSGEGCQFGYDLPTLWMTVPGLARAYVQVKAEGRRRYAEVAIA